MPPRTFLGQMEGRIWEKTNVGDWGEIAYGPRRAEVDADFTRWLDGGRTRFPELYRNAPRKCAVRDMYICHVEKVSYLDMTQTGRVPHHVFWDLEDVGESANHLFGWQPKLRYEFYHSPGGQSLRVVITNMDYHANWLEQQAKRATLALLTAARHRKLSGRDALPRALIWYAVRDNANAWESQWEADASDYHKRVRLQ